MFCLDDEFEQNIRAKAKEPEAKVQKRNFVAVLNSIDASHHQVRDATHASAHLHILKGNLIFILETFGYILHY